MMTKLRYKCYNKQITTCDTGNVQSHDQKETKLNSTITKNSVVHKHTHNKIIKSTLNMLNTATINYNWTKKMFNIKHCLGSFSIKLFQNTYWYD